MLFAATGLASGARANDPAIGREHVRLVERGRGDVVSLWVELDGCTEATVAVEVRAINMRSTAPANFTVEVRRPAVEVARLAPDDPSQQHQYRYTFTCQVGVRPRREPGRQPAYALPYDRDAVFEVSQGRIGRFSHARGSDDENAIDWLMPIGSNVRAARGGTVIAVRDDSTVSGLDPAYKRGGNHVVVRHDDGTLADYIHLKAGGVRVRPGQMVATGDLLGLSGNTGYTDRPHLHVIVFRVVDGKTRRTIPVLYRTKGGLDDPLEEGRSY